MNRDEVKAKVLHVLSNRPMTMNALKELTQRSDNYTTRLLMDLMQSGQITRDLKPTLGKRGGAPHYLWRKS